MLLRPGSEMNMAEFVFGYLSLDIKQRCSRPPAGDSGYVRAPRCTRRGCFPASCARPKVASP